MKIGCCEGRSDTAVACGEREEEFAEIPKAPEADLEADGSEANGPEADGPEADGPEADGLEADGSLPEQGEIEETAGNTAAYEAEKEDKLQ